MNDEAYQRPRLRHVEAHPVGEGNDRRFALRDPSGLSEAVLTVSEPALFILSQLDGSRTLAEISAQFESRYGQKVRDDTLHGLIDNLRDNHLLDGPVFDAHVASQQRVYQSARTRPSLFGTRLGSANEVRTMFTSMIPMNGEGGGNGLSVTGIIAPHLDYARGSPCYGKAYGVLRTRPCPHRVIVLGTNHFGRSTSVVATSRTFETVLGETEVDLAFLEAVEERCGASLRTYELDHLREHSVELQVLILQYLYGADSFSIVPFLCPDPCGPTGTRPMDGDGIDLHDFVRALGEQIRRDGSDTLLIAGADLSHVGTEFGDTFRLDARFLSEVADRDRRALGFLESMRPDAFLTSIGDGHNPTRVCSAGCMFAVASALSDAKPQLLHYHQAFDEESQVCVSCAAMVFSR